jgi:excisionase family DNA binding protein
MARPEVKPEFIGVRDIAKKLGIHASTIYRLVASGELNAYRIGKGRKVVRISELDEFLQSRKTSTGTVHQDFSGRGPVSRSIND